MGKSTVDLPEPVTDSGVSLEQVMLRRRSVREYTDEPLELAELSPSVSTK